MAITLSKPKGSILFINRVFPPAEGATGELLADLAAGLTELGWQVTVLTGNAGDQAMPSDTAGPIRVERVRARPFPRSGYLRRALAYLALYPRLLWHALRLPPADIIITKTDPPLQCVLGPLLRMLKRGRIVHWTQDVYPEVAQQLGIVKKQGPAAKALQALSGWALRSHDRIVVIGRCMQEHLLGRGIGREKVVVIPNWAADVVAPVAHEDNPFREVHALQGRFVVMYSGNMGLAYPFEAILEAAACLQASEPNILFLLIGSGPRLDWIQDQVARRQLGNVRLLPLQPRRELAFSLSAGDLHLVSMYEEVCGLVVPSKIYSGLAAGRPCLFLGPEASEAARLLRAHRCGDVLSGTTGERLADRIRAWHRNAARCRAAGARARTAVEHGRCDAIRAFDALLEDVLQPNPSSASVPVSRRFHGRRAPSPAAIRAASEGAAYV